jgi:hypothetical protein
MAGITYLTVLVAIYVRAMQLAFAFCYLGILVAVVRAGLKYRQTGWLIGIAYAVLCLTIPVWTMGLAWLFEMCDLGGFPVRQ